jgi:hypothetical protein
MILLSAGVVVCIAALALTRQHGPTEAVDSATPRAVDVSIVKHQAPQSAPAEQGIRLPAPPRGQPVAQVQDALRTRAEHGDAAAATMLARGLQLCWWMLEQANVQKPDYRDPNQPRELTEDEHHWIDGWEQAQEFIRQNTGYCQGLSAAEIDKLKAAALLTAAKLGDAEAAACFVSDTFYYARPMDLQRTYPAERDDPELAAMYSTEAVQVAEAGVQRGDWRMVAMLGSIYSEGSSANPFGHKVAQPDGEKRYLYGALRELGITDPDWLQRIKEMPMQPAEFGISGVRAQELRDEAQHLFDLYFRQSGPFPQDLALCHM